MARLWLTYAWRDNESNDVDFVVQELERAGLTVNLDRYHIGAGGRLWEQIEAGIVDPDTAAWAIYATPSSLASQACREEMAIALDRALTTRDETFPLIGIFPGAVERESVPALIRTRRYVNVADADWLERVVAAVERRDVAIPRSDVAAYVASLHPMGSEWALELRPRLGQWRPIAIGIPKDDEARLNPRVVAGMPGGPSGIGITSAFFGVSQGYSPGNDGEEWWIFRADDPAADQGRSYYLLTKELPGRVAFGQPPSLYIYEPTNG